MRADSNLDAPGSTLSTTFEHVKKTVSSVLNGFLPTGMFKKELCSHSKGICTNIRITITQIAQVEIIFLLTGSRDKPGCLTPLTQRSQYHNKTRDLEHVHKTPNSIETMTPSLELHDRRTIQHYLNCNSLIYTTVG